MNPETEPSNATQRQSLEIGAIEGMSESVQDDGFSTKSPSNIPFLKETVYCSFCESGVLTEDTIKVTLFKDPQKIEHICFDCAEKTKLTVNNFVAKMNVQDWKKSAQFRAKIATLTFGRASPPDTIIGFLHRKKICEYCKPPKHIPLMETEHDHIREFHESISFIYCHNCCERFIKERNKKAAKNQLESHQLVLKHHERKCPAHKNIRMAKDFSQKLRIFDAAGKIIRQSFSCPIKDCRIFCATDEQLLLHFSESDHFWIPMDEDARKLIQTEQANGGCVSYIPQGITSLRFVQTNCEFCDALVFISDTIEVSNQHEFDGKPIWICTGCAEYTKLTVENMADMLNCREWTMSEKLRFFIHSLRIDYDLDGVNSGTVLGFIYKRRKCNICQMHLTIHETLEQHFQKHHSSFENSTFSVCPKGCERIIQTGYERVKHTLKCGYYCADCRKWFPKHSLHFKNYHFLIDADGKFVDQVFACPAPGCFFRVKEDILLIRHLEASNYFWKLMPKSDQYLIDLDVQILPDITIMNAQIEDINI